MQTNDSRQETTPAIPTVEQTVDAMPWRPQAYGPSTVTDPELDGVASLPPYDNLRDFAPIKPPLPRDTFGQDEAAVFKESLTVLSEAIEAHCHLMNAVYESIRLTPFADKLTDLRAGAVRISSVAGLLIHFVDEASGASGEKERADTSAGKPDRPERGTVDVDQNASGTSQG